MSPFLLDKWGFYLALTMGVLIFIAGRQYGASMLSLIFIFLILSVIVTKYGANLKLKMNIYEGERSWKNVLSNGLMPTFVAILYYVYPSDQVLFMYVASLSSVLADKFASELGVFDKPAFLWGMKEVKPGTSGAVSILGTLAALSGALIISLISMVLFPVNIYQVFLLGIIGFLGSMADSLFGIFEEWGIGNKFTTNFICSLVGILLAYLISL